MEHVPAFMRERSQWLVWRLEKGETKVPLSTDALKQYLEHRQTEGAVPKPSIMRGNANAPRNLTNYLDAVALAKFAIKEKMDAGIAFAFAGDAQMIAFDFDDVIDSKGKIHDKKIAAVIGNLETYVEYSPSGTGLHAYCVITPALKAKMSERIGAFTPFTSKGGGGDNHHVYINGGYVTFTGRVFENNRELNLEADKFMRDWFDAKYPGATSSINSNDNEDVDLEDGGVQEQVDDCLDKIDADCDRDTWIKVGMVLHKITGGDDRGLKAWDDWSRTAPNRYPNARQPGTRKIYRGFDGGPSRSVSLGTLVHLAKEWSGDTKAAIGRAREQLQRTISSAMDSLSKLARARGVHVQESEQKEGLEIVSASDVPIEATRWLWTDFVPFGHLVLVSGGVSAGKSSWLLKLTSDTSHAKPLPYDTQRKRYQDRIDKALGKDNILGKPYKRSGLVYYLTSEMHWSQTAVPTLRANNANLDNIKFMRRTVIHDKKTGIKTRPFDLVMDLNKLINHIVVSGIIPDMIILDPITSFMGTTVDRNAESDVRAILEMMADFCAAIGTAFIGVLHQNKSMEQSGVGKLLGSVAFGAVARVVLFVVRTQMPNANETEATSWEDQSKHLAVLVEKSNIGGTDTVNIFKLQPSPLLGVNIEHVEDLTMSEFVRRTKEVSKEKAAPKRAAVQQAINDICVETGHPFTSVKDICTTVAQSVDASVEYIRQMLDNYFVVNKVGEKFKVINRTTQ